MFTFAMVLQERSARLNWSIGTRGCLDCVHKRVALEMKLDDARKPLTGSVRKAPLVAARTAGLLGTL